MDGSRFDALTRRLASGHSRRRVLQGLAGTAVAALAGFVGRDSAAAYVGR